MPKIMATSLAPLVHALRSDQCFQTLLQSSKSKYEGINGIFNLHNKNTFSSWSLDWGAVSSEYKLEFCQLRLIISERLGPFLKINFKCNYIKIKGQFVEKTWSRSSIYFMLTHNIENLDPEYFIISA